jgi:hypothetical protein
MTRHFRHVPSILCLNDLFVNHFEALHKLNILHIYYLFGNNGELLCKGWRADFTAAAYS